MTDLQGLLLVRAAALRRFADPTERKRVREAAGLTQAELAAVLRVPTATVSNWEQGHTPYGVRLREYVGCLENLRQTTGGDQ
jgi:DNA-binding transcriptional regulator YiaG